MSIRLVSIKNINNQNKKLSVNLLATRRFPSREMAQNTQRFRQNGSNDGHSPTTDSPSISYASADRKEDSVHQNSNRLSGSLKPHYVLVWKPNEAKLKKYTMHCTVVYSTKTLYYYLSTIQTLSLTIILSKSFSANKNTGSIVVPNWQQLTSH